jgi:hypothetical protein
MIHHSITPCFPYQYPIGGMPGVVLGGFDLILGPLLSKMMMRLTTTPQPQISVGLSYLLYLPSGSIDLGL